jgi:hypothetical protein
VYHTWLAAPSSLPRTLRRSLARLSLWPRLTHRNARSSFCIWRRQTACARVRSVLRAKHTTACYHCRAGLPPWIVLPLSALRPQALSPQRTARTTAVNSSPYPYPVPIPVPVPLPVPAEGPVIAAYTTTSPSQPGSLGSLAPAGTRLQRCAAARGQPDWRAARLRVTWGCGCGRFDIRPLRFGSGARALPSWPCTIRRQATDNSNLQFGGGDLEARQPARAM